MAPVLSVPCSVYGCPLAKKRKTLDRQPLEALEVLEPLLEPLETDPKSRPVITHMDNSTREESYETDGTVEMDDREEELEEGVEDGGDEEEEVEEEEEEGYLEDNEEQMEQEEGEVERGEGEAEEVEVEQEEEEDRVQEEEEEEEEYEEEYEEQSQGQGEMSLFNPLIHQDILECFFFKVM